VVVGMCDPAWVSTIRARSAALVRFGLNAIASTAKEIRRPIGNSP